MTRIFISYRRDDSAGYVGRLYDRLADHFGSQHIFMDIDTLEPGLDFVAAVEDAVRSCDAALVVIGKQWLTATDEQGQRRLDNPHDFVRLEVATALKRDIRVIPVLVRDAGMPRDDALPEDLKPLVRRHALTIKDHDFHYDVDQLIDILDRVVSPPPQPPPSRPPPPPSRTYGQPPPPSRGRAEKPQVRTESIPHPQADIFWWMIMPSAVVGAVGGAATIVVSDPIYFDRYGPSLPFYSVVVLSWLVHGVVFRWVFQRTGLSEHKDRNLIWWISSALRGGPASSLLLRTTRPPAGWFTVVVVFVGWIIAVVAGLFAAMRVFPVPGDYIIPIGFWGFTTGALGGFLMYLAVKWSRRHL